MRNREKEGEQIKSFTMKNLYSIIYYVKRKKK